MIVRLMRSLTKRMAAACDMHAVPRCNRLTLDAALERCSQRAIGSVIDIGASDGRWTRTALRHFPAARYLLIEAQAAPHEAALARLAASHANVEFLLAAAGDRQGMLHFDASDPLGGLASDQPFAANNIEVPAVTIDAAVAERQLPPPYLLKLDTHGFETPIFAGASETLVNTSLVIVEVYNFTLCDGALRFPRMCEFLEQRGFRPLDLFDVMHRSRDGALWQFDLLFGRSTDSEFQSNSFA